VQTAAGPGAGAAVPLLIQFANSQNNIDSSAFEAGAENDNAGYREYMAWYCVLSTVMINMRVGALRV